MKTKPKQIQWTGKNFSEIMKFCPEIDFCEDDGILYYFILPNKEKIYQNDYISKTNNEYAKWIRKN